MATASCDASKINLFGSKKLKIQKETAALIVVYMDLAMIIVYWLSMIFVKPMVALTHTEVTNSTVNASDFSVYFKNEIVNYRMDTFKAEMWAWAERILEKSTQ